MTSKYILFYSDWFVALRRINHKSIWLYTKKNIYFPYLKIKCDLLLAYTLRAATGNECVLYFGKKKKQTNHTINKELNSSSKVGPTSMMMMMAPPWSIIYFFTFCVCWCARVYWKTKTIFVVHSSVRRSPRKENVLDVGLHVYFCKLSCARIYSNDLAHTLGSSHISILAHILKSLFCVLAVSSSERLSVIALTIFKYTSDSCLLFYICICLCGALLY